LSLKERLACRLVNKNCKKNIDERLEAFTLSSFTRWRPYVDDEPEVTPILKLRRCFDKNYRKTHVFVPIPSKYHQRVLPAFPIDKLPFATKSLGFYADGHYGDKVVDPDRLDFPSVFGSCGTLLTSLSLSRTNRGPVHWRLPTLIGALSRTPNLKALHLGNLWVCDPSKDPLPTPPPPLPHLKTLLALGSTTDYSLKRWLLKASLPPTNYFRNNQATSPQGSSRKP